MKKHKLLKTKTKKRISRNKTTKKPQKEKILRAATKVFSLHPYASASMRTIAKEARIDHPLIIYYFPTKAAVFEAVLKELKDKYKQTMPTWFQGIGEMSLVDGVSTYLDRALAFHYEHPEIFRIMLMNMTQSVRKRKIIPGYQHIQDFLNIGADVIRRRSRFTIKPEQMASFIKCISLLMINLIGAREYHAEIQSMNPESEAYLKWVKKQIMFIVIPVLNSLELKV